MDAKFKVGQRVKRVGFINCFNQQISEKRGLVVTKVTLFEGRSIKPYYRYVAADPIEPRRFMEGAERYFEAEA